MIRSPDQSSLKPDQSSLKPEKPSILPANENVRERAASLAKDLLRMQAKIDKLCKEKTEMGGRDPIRLILARNSIKSAVKELQEIAGIDKGKAPLPAIATDAKPLAEIAAELVKEMRDILPQVEELRREAAGKREGMKFMLVGSALESTVDALEKIGNE